MKKITLLSTMFLSLCSLMTKATVLTVSNSPISGGQYTDIQTAINAASVDDTVYVNGSAITYPNATINKRITMIGAGYYVTGTQYNMSSIVNTITIDSASFSTNPISGTHIEGMNMSNLSVTGRYNGIHVERCFLGSINAPGDGFIIEGNVIDYLSVYNNTGNISSCIVRNNFIYGYIWANGQMNAPGLLIDHNIIEGVINTISYALVTNNIFFFADISTSSSNTFNIYNDNITVYPTPDVLPFGNNSGSGNFNNVSPATLFAGAATSTVSSPALFGYDWHVLAGSVAHNAASDGTDIGLYGGSNPMPNFTGATTLPQMTLMNINNSSIPVNGTLNYEFKARKQN